VGKATKRNLLVVPMLATMIALSFLSACSSNNGNGNMQKENDPSKEKGSAVGKTDEQELQTYEPLGKYDPPINLKIGRTADSFKFEEGQNIDKNILYDFYERELGVKLTNEWVVPTDQYAAKSNVSISSGNIPDVFWVDGAQLRNLVEADMIEDLTDLYEKYASEDTKKTLAEDGGYAIKSATIDGKMYAFPAVTQGFWTANVLWVRQDWLDKLGLQPPKTVDELIHIASEFIHNNPEGTKGVQGIGVTKELEELNGFFNSFHAYPNQWVRDQEGNIVYGGIQPESKAALLKLAELYKAGLIDMEFGIKDGTKITEALAAGKLGIVFSSFGFPFSGGAKDLMVNNPDAELNAYPIPSIDGDPAKAYIGPTASQFFVVKKGYKHPEVVIKLANFFTEHAMVNPKPEFGTNNETGVMYWQYSVLAFNSPMMQINEHRAVKAALEANEEPDRSKLTNNEFEYLKGSYNYLKNRKDMQNSEVQTGWMFHKTFGTPHSGAEAMDHYFINNQTIVTPLVVASTPTMAQKMPTLLKMQKVLYTKLILGEATESDFDKFVADWKKQGGDEITAELNQ